MRAISRADVEAFYTVYSNPEVMRYWSTPPLPNVEAASKLISEIHEGNERHDMCKWGIALRSNDALIGSVTLFNLELTHHRAEID